MKKGQRGSVRVTNSLCEMLNRIAIDVFMENVLCL